MTRINKIAILVHEHDRMARRFPYIVWFLQNEWESRGIEIEILRGTGKVVDADILFPQIDLSVVPDTYLRYFENYPKVINRDIRDIRKTSFSSLRVEPGDGWEGPVILKSNLNYGGFPEVRLGSAFGRIELLASKMIASIRRFKSRQETGKSTELRLEGPINPHDYPVFERASDVPEEIYRHPNIIVERFLKEPSEQGYVLRSYNFLGSRGFTRRRVSSDPIVKASNSRLIDSPPIPRGLIELRNELGFDYGKIDYLEYDGQTVPLDINTTPTIVKGSDQDSLLRDLRDLAWGIEDIV